MCMKCVGKRGDSVSYVGKRVIFISNVLARGVIYVSNVLARGVDMRIRSVCYKKIWYQKCWLWVNCLT